MSTIQLQLSAALDAEITKAERRERERKSPIERFHEIIFGGRQGAPVHAVHVVSSPVMRAIERNSHPSGTRRQHDLYAQYAGIPIVEKPGQQSPCLAFRNREDADQYLDGRVTEEALIAITTPLSCPATNTESSPEKTPCAHGETAACAEPKPKRKRSSGKSLAKTRSE